MSGGASDEMERVGTGQLKIAEAAKELPTF